MEGHDRGFSKLKFESTCDFGKHRYLPKYDLGLVHDSFMTFPLPLCVEIIRRVSRILLLSA